MGNWQGKVMADVQYGIEVCKKGKDFTLYLQNTYCKQYVLSKFKPQEDALSLIEWEEANSQTIWILFGFGFGYILDELHKKLGKQIKVIIIEPDQMLLGEQIKLQGKEWIYNQSNIKIFYGTDFERLRDIFYANIPQQEINNIKIITLRGYLEFYIAYYREVLNRLNEDKVNKVTELYTKKGLGTYFIRNIIRNRYAIQDFYDLTQHKDKYKGIPALVVSAGPSLSKNIQYIKDFKGLIFTGGRTLSTILEQGAEPNFVVSIDPKPITYHTFRDAVNNNFPLITLDKSDYSVIQANGGPKYFVNADEEEVPGLLGINLPRPIDVGGSVATVCMSAATYMGCSPVVFIGQDLAYTDMKAHADLCGGIANNLNLEGEKGKEYFEVDEYHGGKVYTDVLLLSYLRWIEMYISLHPETEFINATEGGAKVVGTQQMTFKEVVERYQLGSSPLIQHLQNQKKVDVDKHLFKALENLTLLKKKCQQAESVAKQLIEEFEQYNGLRESEINRLSCKLNGLDQDMLEMTEGKDIAAYLFQSAYDEIELEGRYKAPVRENQIEQGIRVSKLSREIYRTLEKSVGEVVEIIQAELKAMESEALVK